ncbi:MAG: eL32 family ribosomal protein [Candidatus Marsarchaeota archaeon]|nr:eL32 family ribosomal protein [Candidatus Marsarchaeota archaeon]
MVEKKRHPKFRVPNYGAKSMKRVPARWRKQRGTDNKLRIEKSGYGATPKIGYKNPNALRFARPDGLRGVLVHNESELLALQKAEGRIAIFAHGLSSRKRVLLQKLADSNGIKIANRSGR